MDEQVLGRLDAGGPTVGEADGPAMGPTVAEMEARWRDAVVQGAVGLALQARGCRDVEAGLVLLDRAGVSVNEDGAVAGVDTAVAALHGARPYLFAPRMSGGAVNPAAMAPPADPASAFAGWLRGRLNV